MDVYTVKKFSEAVRGNAYPGRGIVAGESLDGTKAVVAYFKSYSSRKNINFIFLRLVRENLYNKAFAMLFIFSD